MFRFILFISLKTFQCKYHFSDIFLIDFSSLKNIFFFNLKKKRFYLHSIIELLISLDCAFSQLKTREGEQNCRIEKLEGLT